MVRLAILIPAPGRRGEQNQDSKSGQPSQLFQGRNNVRACREKADKKMREILNDNQKKKLDQLEQETHPELHGA